MKYLRGFLVVMNLVDASKITSSCSKQIHSFIHRECRSIHSVMAPTIARNGMLPKNIPTESHEINL